MPNIEMYGFNQEQASGVTAMIMELFKNKPYRDEYVTTAVWSDVLDHRNVSQPYLRLVSTPNDHIEDIVEELLKLKFDVEVLILNRFIPKE